MIIINDIIIMIMIMTMTMTSLITKMPEMNEKHNKILRTQNLMKDNLRETEMSYSFIN